MSRNPDNRSLPLPLVLAPLGIGSIAGGVLILESVAQHNDAFIGFGAASIVVGWTLSTLLAVRPLEANNLSRPTRSRRPQ